MLRRSALGRSALGRSALGRSALGLSALDSSALGSSALGSSTLGPSALDSSALDSSALGSSTLGPSALDSSALGRSTLGPSTLRRFVLGLPALLLARPAAAVVEIRNQVPQGGLLLGRGAAGTQITLDGRPVRVSAAGDFVLGFGRDHGPEATLGITPPHGRTESRAIGITRRQWDVQAIDGLPPAQVTPDAATLARIVEERARLAAARATDSALTGFIQPMAWPARGRISGVYGSQRVLNGQPRQPHYGLDVAGPVGTPVLAALPGRVTLAADFHFFGKVLVLDHGHGINTLYAHLSAIFAREGATITQSQHIAAMGATGRVTGPHLHFSLGWFQTWLDPQPLLTE